ncbi:MAG: hypothetical protein O2995_15310 [Proteobacteria bacterium]|nr:hypothetical protein [Pseudomonadota bacterium]
MKFLVETELYQTVPLAQIEGLVAKQLDRSRTGYGPGLDQIKVEFSYGVAGRRGAVFVVDAPDAESLQRLLVNAPLFHFETMKVTPLVDLRVSLGLIAETAANLCDVPTKSS